MAADASFSSLDSAKSLTDKADLSVSKVLYESHKVEATAEGLLKITIFLKDEKGQKLENPDRSPRQIEKLLRISVGQDVIRNPEVVKKMAASFESGMLIQEMAGHMLERGAETATHDVTKKEAGLRFSLDDKGISVQKVAQKTADAPSKVETTATVSYADIQTKHGTLKGSKFTEESVRHAAQESVRIATTHHDCKAHLDRIFTDLPPSKVVQALEQIIGKNALPLSKLPGQTRFKGLDPEIQNLAHLLNKPGNEGLRYALMDKLAEARRDVSEKGSMWDTLKRGIGDKARSDLLGFILERVHIPAPSVPEDIDITEADDERAPAKADKPEVDGVRPQFAKAKERTSDDLQPATELAPMRDRRMDALLQSLHDKIADPAAIKRDIAALPPAQRTALKQALAQMIQEKEKAQAKDAVGNLKVIQKALKEVIQENADKKLLSALKNNEKRGDVPVTELLILSNKSIIPTERLFTTLLEDLKTEVDENKRAVLLKFCVDWAKANRTSAAYEKASPIIAQIIAQATKETASINEKTLGAELRQIHTNDRGYEMPSVQEGAKTFDSILKELRDTRLETQGIKTVLPGPTGYDDTVKLVAADLGNIQKAFYQQMTPQNVTQNKANVDADIDSPCRMSADFFNKTHAYFTAQIDAETDPAKKRRLIKFVINVTQACIDNRDYTSAMALRGVLFSINKQGQAQLKSVVKDKTYDKLRKSHEELFKSSKNYANLKAKTKEASVPALPPYLTSLEIAGSVRSDPFTDDEEYNMNPILAERGIAAEFLKQQPTPSGAKAPAIRLKTNLFSVISSTSLRKAATR